MPYSILILDDDADFNSLLTDIFEQADYVVTSVTDPLEAVEAFRETAYDLVVADQKMPDMSGAEFMQEIKRSKPEVPVVIVSGYIENETIRELIRDGVSGVFLKPLNIFSLLKRTGELVEEAKKLKSLSSQSPVDGHFGDSPAQLDFAFRSFPCKSGPSTAFAEQLHSLRNFKSILSLVGEPGTHYRRICEDIQGFSENENEQLIFLSAGSFDEEQTLSLIEKAQKEDAERITFVLLEFETMDAAQKDLASKLAKHKEPFQGLETTMRTIFCLGQDLDSLMDQEQIDESLYILMGTSEVRVPPLRECHPDIAIMAQQLLVEIAREKSMAVVPRLESGARDRLGHYSWEGNFRELAGVLRQLAENNNNSESISAAAVRAAVEGETEEPLRIRLHRFLDEQEVDYLHAASVLFGGDRKRMADLFKIDPSVIDEKMN